MAWFFAESDEGGGEQYWTGDWALVGEIWTRLDSAWRLAEMLDGPRLAICSH